MVVVDGAAAMIFCGSATWLEVTRVRSELKKGSPRRMRRLSFARIISLAVIGVPLLVLVLAARGTSFVGLVLLPIAVFLPALLSQLLFWRPHSPRAVVLANSPERRRQNEKRADFYTRFGMEDNKRLEGAKLRLVTVELAVTFSVALARLQFDRSIIGVFGWAFIATIGTGLILRAVEGRTQWLERAAGPVVPAQTTQVQGRATHRVQGIYSQSEVQTLQRKAAAEIPPGEERTRIHWGCELRSNESLHTHFLAVGANGSGKTNCMKMMVYSVLLDSGESGHPKVAALLNDPKTDYLPILHRMGVPIESIIVANPLDRRSPRWDVARDLETFELRQEFARTVAPLPPHPLVRYKPTENSFWQIVAHQTVAQLIEALHHRAGLSWELRDLVESTASLDTMRQLLRTTAEGQQIDAAYFAESNARLQSNCFATLVGTLSHFRDAAHLWHRSTSTFTIRHWKRDRKILLLGHNYRLRRLLTPLANLLVHSAFAEVMAQPGDHVREHTWFFLDEVSTVGRFQDLALFLKNSRGKGGRAVLADQSFSSLRSAFAREDVPSILSECGNKAILSLNSAEDREEASRLFGECEQPDVSTGYQSTKEGFSYQQGMRRKARVPAEEFAQLRPADANGGALDMWLQFPADVSCRAQLSAQSLDEYLPDRIDASQLPQSFAAFQERPPEHREPIAWDESDHKRLGLKPARHRLRLPSRNPLDRRSTT